MSKKDTKKTVEKTTKKKAKNYVVVHDFKDLKGNNRIYTKGDIYPAIDADKPTASRIKELSSIKNKLNKVLIKERG